MSQADPSKEPSKEPPKAGADEPAVPADGAGRRWGAVLLPAATFVVGLVLGWAVVAVGEQDDVGGALLGDPSPSASPEPSEEPGEGDLVMLIPGECREAAENLQEATRVLRDSLGSVRDFDPDVLVDNLNRLEQLDDETRPLIDRCSVGSDMVSEAPAD